MPAPERTLTLRELNRATLARQILLGREALPVPEAVGRLIGLQAQVVSPPYAGLWTRLEGFRPRDLTHALEERKIVRATLMRSTLHLMTAEDYLLLRPALQPALSRALNSFFGKRARGLDAERIVAAARAYLDEEPRAYGELRSHLAGLYPDRDPEALAYAARTYLPMVQVPSVGAAWGFSGRPPYATSESWLGEAPSGSGSPRALILRYLAAFGPATTGDAQAYLGMARLKEHVEALRPELRAFRDEGGRELFDLPDAPLPGADAPAPVRFLPEYDNVLLAHADRTRVIADEHRARVFLSAGRVRATFLVDGFVAGTWKVEREGGSARLEIEPFGTLPDETRSSLDEEGERLLRFFAEPSGAT
ncbi:winged helix DNA-binding domain-containing protein [Rubrobacter marinus]|uniref:Winged helix DNA-binding domain-containing protein n=1 Tax=Rubrobacter marinus TaxID=2653852 RepID=A0A6G8PYP2_9ACTN|nr:winged helix DNA-binding domain-containing protein [Rubrobacter marinus]QIN79322.1 winged helix DNA-binding domain-containing protein [Rubrobacter marinus]